MSAPPSIVCPHCGLRSYHPLDISYRYCVRCHVFHEGELMPIILLVYAGDEEMQPGFNCPTCETLLDCAAAVAARGEPPIDQQTLAPVKKGDLALCAYCGQILRLIGPKQVEALPAEDFSLLPLSQRAQLIAAIETLRQVPAPHGRNDPTWKDRLINKASVAKSTK